MLSTAKRGRPSASREQIVCSALKFVEEHLSEHVSGATIANAIGISERTLRTAFQEYFGMGPVRYLKLRLINLVHGALQEADPSLTTVTQIVTKFGIWELGRFAQDYRVCCREQGFSAA